MSSWHHLDKFKVAVLIVLSSSPYSNNNPLQDACIYKYIHMMIKHFGKCLSTSATWGSIIGSLQKYLYNNLGSDYTSKLGGSI